MKKYKVLTFYKIVKAKPKGQFPYTYKFFFEEQRAFDINSKINGNLNTLALFPNLPKITVTLPLTMNHGSTNLKLK